MNIKGKKQAMHTKFTLGLLPPQTERRGFYRRAEYKC
jgi:hypothetical protein